MNNRTNSTMIKLINLKNLDILVDQLSEFLVEKLTTHDKVLWLLSGGSNIAVECKIMDKIPDNLTGKLIIGLIDERFGKLNHADSNMFQLRSAGFKQKQSIILEIINNDTATIESATDSYDQALTRILEETDIYSVGQLGMGLDGHVAGLLPDNPIMDSDKLVDHYSSHPFKRISLTPKGLSYLNQVFLVINDESKQKMAYKMIEGNSQSEAEMPAMILNRYNSVTVYNINN